MTAAPPGEEGPRERQARILLDFARVVATATTTQETLDAVCAYGPKALGVSTCAVLLLEGDAATGVFAPRAVAGAPAAQRAKVLKMRLPLSEPHSVAARVLRSGEPAVFDDAQAARHGESPFATSSSPLALALGLRSMLLMPLRAPEGPLGLLVLGDTECQAAFDPHTVTLAGLLAQQAGLALRNAAQREAAEARAERLHSLSEVAAEATSAPALEALFERITASAARLLAADIAYLRLWDEAEGGLRLCQGHGDPQLVAQLSPLLRPGEGTSGLAWQDGRAATVADYQTLPGRSLNLAAAGYRVSAAVVLTAGSGRLGTLIVGRSRPEPFSAEDLELLGLFAQQAAQAIERASLLAQAEATLARLAASEARFRTLVERAPDAILLFGADGVISDANVAAEHLNGIPLAELIGRRVDALFGPAAAEELLRGLSSGRHLRRELTISRPDGATIPVAVHAVGVGAEGQGVYLAIVHELSERKRVEEQLVRAERLRATGELAAGVAHNVNNLLSIILGHAELLRLWHHNGTLTPAKLGDGLQTITQAVEDGAAMVRRLNEFTRTTLSRAPESVDIVALAREAVALTRPRWQAAAQAHGASIDLVLDLAPVPPVRGVASELQEALVNLILNAADAMPQGGRLTLATRQAEDLVEVSVGDTGIGMPPDVQARLFEPFFTTKGLVGPGLGLAVTHSIVQRHGGKIHVESAPGQGSRFTIHLPAARPEKPAPKRPRRAAPHALRLVVVDDEAAVLKLLREFLRLDHHEVRAFASPADALASIASDPPDAVLTDVAMPGMTGWDLARQLGGQVPVILVTGWGDANGATPVAVHGVVSVLYKPFGLEDLRRALARISPRR